MQFLDLVQRWSWGLHEKQFNIVLRMTAHWDKGLSVEAEVTGIICEYKIIIQETAKKDSLSLQRKIIEAINFNIYIYLESGEFFTAEDKKRGKLKWWPLGWSQRQCSEGGQVIGSRSSRVTQSKLDQNSFSVKTEEDT